MDYHLNNSNDLAEVEKYKERLSIALKAAKICVFEVDLSRQLYTFFENAEDIFGVSGQRILEDVQPFSALSPEEYQKAASAYFSHPDDAQEVNRAFEQISQGKPTTYQARMKAGDSNFVWCKLDVSPIMENGAPVKMIGVITDISEIKARTTRLEQRAQLDGFTGLYNKNCAIGSIRAHLKTHSFQQHAFVLIDIDNLKAVNDTFGHAVGDKIILETAEALSASFRKDDIIGRFGGDEFIVLAKDIPDAQWIGEKLKSLMECEGSSCNATRSAGVAIFPDDADSFEELFEKADKALYRSKLIRKTCTLYSNI